MPDLLLLYHCRPHPSPPQIRSQTWKFVSWPGRIWSSLRVGFAKGAPRAGGVTKNSPYSESLFMPKVGLEPTWGNPHYALNVARLPIPPLRLFFCGLYFISKACFVNLNRILLSQTDSGDGKSSPFRIENKKRNRCGTKYQLLRHVYALPNE